MRPYDSATPLIPATYQPALALDYARSQEVAPEKIVAKTTWDTELASHWQCRMTPGNYLQLLVNIKQAIDSDEVPFALGQQMLPGHYGNCSRALLQAHSLRHALEILTRHAALFCPLLVPHFRTEKDKAILYWTAACGLGPMHGFVVDMHMSAVVALAHWRRGGKLPWTFCFNRTQPRSVAAHQVHLGTRLQFGCQVDAMLIDAHWLDEAWEPVVLGPGHVDAHASEWAAQHEVSEVSLLGLLYTHLLANASHMLTLEDMADVLQISPSTLKRKLSLEGTHYQAEVDRVRSHTALQLMFFHDYDNEAVARHLGFYDIANYRRAFKRWTGLTPSVFRENLLDFAWSPS